MELRLSDPSYTDRLETFLRSLGQTVIPAGPKHLEVDLAQTPGARAELEIYLRVWKVLYPDADVQLDSSEDPEPAA